MKMLDIANCNTEAGGLMVIPKGMIKSAISVKVVVAFVKNYADVLRVNLSGLRLTFGIQFQFRVLPVQRNGLTSFAI